MGEKRYMSTRKNIEKLRNIINSVKQSTNINKKKLKVGLLTSALVIMPALVQAQGLEAKNQTPLTSEQSSQLKAKLVKFSPMAKEEPKKIAMEVIPPAPPAPEPQPEPEQPAPEPVRPVARKVVKRTTTRRTASTKGSRASSAGTSYEQCIPFARRVSGVQVRGYAGDVQPNSSEASVGSVALFSSYGHAAVVTGVNGDSVTIKEANYVPGKITERTVPKSQLRGYVK
jgi:hypothetical protein